MGVAHQIRGGLPLINREVILGLVGLDLWALETGYQISDRIVADALWRSTPTIIRYWVFQRYINLYMEPPRGKLYN